MNTIVDVILPVFGLIAVGYLTAASRLLGPATGDALGDFVFVVAVPVLIFRLLATADFAAASPWSLWLAYFSGVAVVWTLAVLMIRSGFGRDARAGVIAGVSAGFANSVLIGIPLVVTAYGEAGAVPLFLIISVHLPVMMVASALLIERAARADGVTVDGAGDSRSMIIRLARNIFTNPIIIGILAGAAWRTTGIAIPGLAAKIIDQLAVVAVPCALFSMGMSLKRYGVSGNIVPAVGLSALKLLVMPAMVYGIARYAVGLPPLWTAVATLVAASPTGINAYLIASRFRTGQGLASNTITLTTGLAVVTAALWLRFLGH
ncbi:MAG: AEC family transporter [Hyphomicrobiales bacterium]|nr:AEC family transporter [Hyphomicrobiales bacterium]